MTSAPKKPKVIVICGPTGVGKTMAAIEIARKFNGEIISADSMQIYRRMDIGTAKPTAAERARVPHHMVDIVDPDEDFNARRFSQLGREVIAQLGQQDRMAFVAGGTGLYIKALLHGLFACAPVAPDIRKHLKRRAEQFGSRALFEYLQKCDPAAASRLHPNDTYRIVRALETFEAGGGTISGHHRRHGFAENPFETVTFGLTMKRERLYERINERVDAMIGAGLLAEVKGLLKMGYGPELKSMQSIGYRHMVDFIAGRLPWDESVRTLKRDSRRYAKRQLTWFGADPTIIWQDPAQLDEMAKVADKFLNS
jgi:tRNA dimethylallyltransferase